MDDRANEETSTSKQVRRVFDRFSDPSPSRCGIYTFDRPQFDVPCERFQNASLQIFQDDTFQEEVRY